MNWVKTFQTEDIPRQRALVCKIEHTNVAIFRTINDEIFALEDRCPHRGGPLSQGIVFGQRVACPLHDWVIALDTGQAVAPDQGCSKKYDVKIEQGFVWIDFESVHPESSEFIASADST